MACFFLGLSLSFKYREIISFALILIAFIGTQLWLNQSIEFSVYSHYEYSAIPFLRAIEAMWSSPMILEFAYGILLFMVYKQLPLYKLRYAKKIKYIVLLLVIIACCLYFTPSFQGHGPLNWGLPSFLLLFALLLYEKYFYFPKINSLYFLGNISFSLYLTHVLVLKYLRSYLDMGDEKGGYVFFIATLLALVVAVLAYYSIEQRAIRVCRNILVRLYSKQRYAEFADFLAWMLQTIQQEHIQVLIVAGDIFDTTTPSYQAQTLYYDFLYQVSQTCCQHVVIVAGNHDSPTFLAAPQHLLKRMQVHIISSVHSHSVQNQVLLLHDAQQQAKLIVCAVPYLRDQDLRLVEANESWQDKEQKLLHAIQQHYAQVALAAQQLQAQLEQPVPIIATGHLFTAGDQLIEGDGVRDLYVGNLAHVHASMFSNDFDYVALGHLHVPQKVGGHDHIRYSGSPLAMGFGEASQQKSVCVVDFDAQCLPHVRLINIPCFQSLERIQGDGTHITQRLQTLIALNKPLWVEVIYDSAQLVADLREQLIALTQCTPVEILAIKNVRLRPQSLQAQHLHERLEELDMQQVFERCLDSHSLDQDQRTELLRTYAEALASFHVLEKTRSNNEPH